MKYSIAIIVAILTLFFAGGCSENDPFPTFNLPVHSKATEIKHQNNQPAIGSKSAVYKVETAFPAEEITEFYNQKFKANGFEKFKNESDQLRAFQWNTTNPTTGNWELAKLPPARYVASWSNENKNLFAWLVINYGTQTLDKKTAQVSIHVAKLSEYLKDVEEMKRHLTN